MGSDLRASEVLSRAIEILGPNGERWHKGTFTDHFGKYCMIGSLGKAVECTNSFLLGDPVLLNEAAFRAWELLSKAISGHVAKFNDAPERTFPEAKAVMCKALKMALDEEEHAESKGNSTGA